MDGAAHNLSSQAGIVALEGHAAYGASKAALDHTTRVLALELGPHGVTVNSVAPTVILTGVPKSGGDCRFVGVMA